MVVSDQLLLFFSLPSPGSEAYRQPVVQRIRQIPFYVASTTLDRRTKLLMKANVNMVADFPRDPDFLRDPNIPRDPNFLRDPNFPRDPDFLRDPNFPRDPDFLRDPNFPRDTNFPRYPNFPREPRHPETLRISRSIITITGPNVTIRISYTCKLLTYIRKSQ